MKQEGNKMKLCYIGSRPDKYHCYIYHRAFKNEEEALNDYLEKCCKAKKDYVEKYGREEEVGIVSAVIDGERYWAVTDKDWGTNVTLKEAKALNWWGWWDEEWDDSEIYVTYL